VPNTIFSTNISHTNFHYLFADDCLLHCVLSCAVL